MMKLRMLIAAAGCVMVPAILGAQTPTDTTKKDTMVAPMPAPAPMPEPAPTPMPEPAAATTPSMPAMAKDSTIGPREAPPSDGKSCPWGCPTSSGAAGLTGVQFLVLQQELRDRKCGNVRVSGRLDAVTRRAIRVCSGKMNVANNAKAVLAAMNVGFSMADLGGTTED